MATQVASLFATLTLDDTSYMRSLGSAEAGILGLGGSITRVGDQMTQLGVGLTQAISPLVNFGRAGISVAADFQESMSEISARTGLVGEDMQQVAEFAQQMGAESVFSAQEAAAGLLDLLASGSSVTEALELLPIVMDAATASGADLGQTADTLTDIMATFGLGAEDAESVVNSLARAAASSSADMVALSAGFGDVGATANRFGLSVDETAAALALLNEAGIKGSTAGRSLRAMLTGITRNSEQTQGALEQLGVSLFDAEGNMRSINDFLPELGLQFQNMSDQELNDTISDLTDTFGASGLTILATGRSIEDMQTTMAGQASATEIAAARMGTFNTTMDSLGGSIEALQTTVFLPFIDNVLQPMAERGIEVINMLTAWAQQNPGTVATIVKLVAVVAALAAGLTIMGPIVSGIGIVIAALTSPIFLAIAAGVALGIAYKENLGGIRDFVEGTIVPMIESFIQKLISIWDRIQPSLEQLGAWFLETILPAIGELVENVFIPIIEFLIETVGMIWDAVSPALEAFGNWFLDTGLPLIVDFITGPFSDVFTALIDLIISIWDLVSPALTLFRDLFVAALGFIITNAVDPVTEAIEFLISIFGSLFEAAADIMGTLGDVLGVIGDVAGAAGGVIGGVGDFLGFAEGGDVAAGQPIRVGERGPEEFIATTPGRITPAEQLGGRDAPLVGSMTIIASGEAEGRAAFRGFSAEMEQLERQRG